MRHWIALICGLVASSAVAADAGRLEQAMQAWCENAKRCTLEQMKGADIPPEMRAMVEQMAASTCAQMQSIEDAAARTHELYEPAVQCLNSMAKMSCDELDGHHQTPECKRYEDEAREMAD